MTARRRVFAANMLLGLLAAVVYALLAESTGRIQVNEGRGWDGIKYTTMMVEGLRRGTVNTQTRPLIVLINRAALSIQRDPVAAFELMNVVYAGLFAVGLALILDHYGARPLAKVFFVTTVAVSIATAQMFAYYPALVDLGAYAVITAALLVVLRGPGVMTAVFCVLAVLSREFGAAVTVFGVCRALRLGVRPLRLVAVYAPATIVFFVWRSIVVSWDPVEAATDLVTMETLLENLQLWRDPFFTGLFLYFLITVLGGVSLILASSPGACLRILSRKPEWLVFVFLVLAASAGGSADVSRYLAFLTPAMAMVFARLESEWSGWTRAALFGIGGALTWYTQRPFSAMDLGRYFSDWFPYYAVLDEIPGKLQVQIWPAWGWRFVVAALGLLVLSTLIHGPSAGRGWRLPGRDMTPGRSETAPA